MPTRQTLCILLLEISLIFNTKAELKMSRIFNSNMVVQRDMSVPVWGWTAPGEKVTVQFKGQTKNTIADLNGKWMLKLAPLPASSVPDKIIVKTSSEKKEFNNVLVGDVWLCFYL
jgi:sialate O-acetylesterase